MSAPAIEQFGIDVSPAVGGTITVAPRGELDLATARELEAWLDDLRRECADVVLDLAEVPFLDSSGLRVLLRARLQARRTHTGLRIANPTRAVRRAAQTAGVPEAVGADAQSG